MKARLDKMLTEGMLQKIRFEDTDEKGPRKGYFWLILFGAISHTTGTSTTAIIRSERQGIGPDNILAYLCAVAAGTATARYSLFSTEPDNLQSQWCPYILSGTDGDFIDFNGAADVLMSVTVLEWAP